MAFLSISLKCDTIWLVVTEVPADLEHCSHRRTRAAGVWVTDVWEWSENELDGLSEGGCFHSLVPHFCLDMAHWPVATALVLSVLRMWRTTRSHFRLAAFNGRPRGTFNMSFIKQWGHKGLGQRRWRCQWEHPSYSKWVLIPVSVPHTQLHTHTHTASCTHQSILVCHPCVSILSPVPLHVCHLQTETQKTLTAGGFKPFIISHHELYLIARQINQSINQCVKFWL